MIGFVFAGGENREIFIIPCWERVWTLLRQGYDAAGRVVAYGIGVCVVKVNKNIDLIFP